MAAVARRCCKLVSLEVSRLVVLHILAILASFPSFLLVCLGRKLSDVQVVGVGQDCITQQGRVLRHLPLRSAQDTGYVIRLAPCRIMQGAGGWYCPPNGHFPTDNVMAMFYWIWGDSPCVISPFLAAFCWIVPALPESKVGG